MGKIEDILRSQAEKQLNKASKAVESGEWVDNLVLKLRKVTGELDLKEHEKKIVDTTIASVESQRDKIAGLGFEAFTLLTQQLAAGKKKDATNTYVSALGSADDIIAAMDRGTFSLIEAKKELDAWYENAWEVVETIAINGARVLLPLLLAL